MENSRRFKDSTLKKPQKIHSKNLNSKFDSVSDKLDSSSEILKESCDSTPISEITCSPSPIYSKNLNSKFNSVSDKLDSSSESFKESCDSTPISQITCSPTTDPTSPVPAAPTEILSSYVLTPTSSQAISSLDEVFLRNIIQEARTLLLNSPYADYRYKKLLDAMVKVVANEVRALPPERNWLAKFGSKKGRTTYILFSLFGFLLAVRFFALTSHNSYSGPPPT